MNTAILWIESLNLLDLGFQISQWEYTPIVLGMKTKSMKRPKTRLGAQKVLNISFPAPPALDQIFPHSSTPGIFLLCNPWNSHTGS